MSRLPPATPPGDAASSGGDPFNRPVRPALPPVPPKMIKGRLPLQTGPGQVQAGRGALPGLSLDAAMAGRERVPGQFIPKAAVATTHPRKVKSGIKLTSKSGPVTVAWAGQRWMRLVEEVCPSSMVAEGLIYARSGQTRNLDLAAGHIQAEIQGRMPYAYRVDIRMPTFSGEQWAQVLEAMLAEARHLAGLLAGEVPSNIEDLFSPLRLRLFPQELHDLSVSCTCSQPPPKGYVIPVPGQNPAALNALTTGEEPTDEQLAEMEAMLSGAPSAKAAAEATIAHEPLTEQGSTPASSTPASSSPASSSPPGPSGWCKHIVCCMALVAERLGNDTFLIFQLRGLLRDALIDQLRAKRAAAVNRAIASGDATIDARPVPAYLPLLPGVSDIVAPPLTDLAADFWNTRPPAAPLDLTMTPPQVSHPLLRRLGGSPFDAATGAKFPLVGLLATCYELISTHTLQKHDAPPPDSHESNRE